MSERMFLKVPIVEDFKSSERDEAIMRSAWAWHERSLKSPIVFGVPPERQEEAQRLAAESKEQKRKMKGTLESS